MMGPLRFTILTFCCTTFLACSSALDLEPDALPYKLETVHQEGQHLLPVDFYQDGDEELVFHGGKLGPRGGGALVIKTLDGKIVDQVNFREPIGRPHALDLDGDGILEVVVPFVRNDSLFVRVVNAQGKRKQLLFLTTGTPRPDDDGVLLWDADVNAVFLADVDDNGDNELVTVVHTGHARLPRGLLIHDISSGRILADCIVGAPVGVGNSILRDFDGDGRLELPFQSNAPNNGAFAGDMADSVSYIGMFELGPSPKVEWKEVMGDRFSSPLLFVRDFDGDGREELLTLTRSSIETPPPTTLQLREPREGTVVREQTLTTPITSATIVNLNRDADLEILALSTSGDLIVFNHRLEEESRRRVGTTASSIATRPDIDGDGVEEIVLLMPTHSILLDPDLRAKAVSPVRVLTGSVRRGTGHPPYLYAINEATDVTFLFRLVENRFYLFKRFGPWFFWGGFASLWVILCVILVKLNREKRKALDSLDQERQQVRALTEKKERQLEEARLLITQLQQELGRAKEKSDESFGEQPASETQEDSLARIYTIIGRDYSDNHFSVEALAAAMQWSNRKLQRYLKEKIDKTPSETIWQFRLDRAKALMDEHEGVIRVSEIAYVVGFENPSHFSTRFKEAFGITPSQYLKKRRTPDSE